MIFEEVSLESIDFNDESFRISEELDPPRLEASLRQVGQLNPAHLIETTGSQCRVVCGFRRLRALRRLGHSRVLAKFWHAGECDLLQAFRLALWENLSHRELNTLETARVLFTLKHLCGVPHDTLVEVYLPILGLPEHKNVLCSYLTLHALPPELRRMLVQGRITAASAEHLSAMPVLTQKKMAFVLDRVRWSATLQREVLALIEELAAIGESSTDEVLDRPEIANIIDDPCLSPFQKGERFYGILFSLRNPRLSQMRERFLTRKKELGLPGSVRISSDPFFENRRVRVEFDVASAKDFREKAQALSRASQAPALEELFRD